MNKISVIVPIYNTEYFLNKCLNSIINQTYKNLEIILINDGSTDGSLEICKIFLNKDDRIKLINQKNRGVSSARNAGLRIATGEYIGFVDSDDYISLSMYKNLLQTIVKQNADIVECGYYRTTSNYVVYKKYPLKHSITEGNYECSKEYVSLSNTTLFNCNKLYAKSVINNIKFSDYRYGEDFLFNAKVFYNCRRKVTLNELYYYYVDNEYSVVNQSFNKSKLDAIEVGKKAFNFYDNNRPSQSEYLLLYIINRIRMLFIDVDQSSIRNKNDYKEYLKQEFEVSYLPIKNNLYNMVNDKKTYIANLMFYVNPSLYILMEKLRNKF